MLSTDGMSAKPAAEMSRRAGPAASHKQQYNYCDLNVQHALFRPLVGLGFCTSRWQFAVCTPEHFGNTL